jgi:hypothetical protein
MLLGEEELLDNIDMDMTSVTFRPQLPKCARKGHQSFLP